jgi:hypothetical protein
MSFLPQGMFVNSHPLNPATTRCILFTGGAVGLNGGKTSAAAGGIGRFRPLSPRPRPGRWPTTDPSFTRY